MNKKTRNTLIVIYVMAFLFTCIGATLAYFTVLNTSAVSHETSIEAATMTSIVFNAGEPISLYADQYNFGENMPSLEGSTYASVTLQNGTNQESSTFYYNLSLELLENTMIYSAWDRSPEVLISVTDPEGNEVKSITGLDYVTVDGVSGFDITGKVGNFMITSNYEITTSTELTQKWDMKLIFVNMKSSQDINKGKGLNGVFKIDPIYEDEQNG